MKTLAHTLREKKNHFALRGLLLLPLILGLSCSYCFAVTIPFYGGFEGYQIGAVPSPPWDRDYNQNSIVVDEQAFEGTNSYKLRGAWNWSDTAHVDMAAGFPDTFTFEVAVRVENGAAAAGQLQFSGNMVHDRNAFWFGPDWDTISFNGVVIVPYCEEDTWYRAVATISGYLGQNPTANVIVYDENGTQLGARFGISAYNINDTPQQHFVLHTRSQPANGQGAVAYFDNVSIIPEPAALSLLAIGILAFLTRIRP